MDIPSAAAWLVLGVVLGILALGAVVAAVAARRWSHHAAPPVSAPPPVDDLAGFFEQPPGSSPETAGVRAEAAGAPGWVTLAPLPPAPPLPRAADQSRTAFTVAALCVTALALVGTAAALAAGTRGADRPPASADETPAAVPPRDRGHDSAVAGDLTVGGLVLEPRAVGITAAYPEVRLRVSAHTTRLELRLPTYNCLTTEAPPDPLAAGCAATLIEHATLTSPEVRVERAGDRLALRGRVATETHPAGSVPEPTGRVYDLELTLAPGGAPEAGAARPAVGELRLGTGTAPVLPARSTLRAGS